MIGSNAKHYRSAFTMAEIMVVLAIFSLLVVAFTDIYARSTKQGQLIVQRTRTQSDARFAVEAIAREIRTYTIDYSAYGGTINSVPLDTLRLVNPANPGADKVIIKRETTDAGCYNDALSYPCLVVSTDQGVSWAPLSAKGTKIDYLDFYVAPSTDPFVINTSNGTYSAGQNPIVTFDVGFHALAGRQQDDWTFNIQTTVTTRLYLR